MSSQGCTLFVAEQLEAGQHSREHEEQDMRQRWFSRVSVEVMIRGGIVTDNSTISAYILYLLSDRNRILE